MLRAELLSCDLHLVLKDLESSEGIACCPCITGLAWDVPCRAALLRSCLMLFPKFAGGTFLVPCLDPEAFAISCIAGSGMNLSRRASSCLAPVGLLAVSVMPASPGLQGQLAYSLAAVCRLVP